MISIKTQKIIKYIPLANFFIFHIWVYNYVNMPKKKGLLWRSIAILMISGILMSIVFSVIRRLLPESLPMLKIVFSLIMAYVEPLVIGQCLIKYQEKVFDAQKND